MKTRSFKNVLVYSRCSYDFTFEMQLRPSFELAKMLKLVMDFDIVWIFSSGFSYVSLCSLGYKYHCWSHFAENGPFTYHLFDQGSWFSLPFLLQNIFCEHYVPFTLFLVMYLFFLNWLKKTIIRSTCFVEDIPRVPHIAVKEIQN